jgi:succinyl-CoA synthetase beta subunit
VTHQSGPEGLPVNVVYVEEGSDIARELYLSMLIDRELSQVSFIASAAGGMDIEQVAADTPEQIFTVAIDPDAGVQDSQTAELSAGLGLKDKQSEQFADLIVRLYKLFVECDASLVEVNPLIVTKSGDVIALDAKINIEGTPAWLTAPGSRWQQWTSSSFTAVNQRTFLMSVAAPRASALPRHSKSYSPMTKSRQSSSIFLVASYAAT